ncbi:MAG TPA: hypothetical protein PKD55_12800 [Bellilinea sp.]|nr:hypothetical protein [Bellilinea sp.]
MSDIKERMSRRPKNWTTPLAKRSIEKGVISKLSGPAKTLQPDFLVNFFTAVHFVRSTCDRKHPLEKSLFPN